MIGYVHIFPYFYQKIDKEYTNITVKISSLSSKETIMKLIIRLLYL